MATKKAKLPKKPRETREWALDIWCDNIGVGADIPEPTGEGSTYVVRIEPTQYISVFVIPDRAIDEQERGLFEAAHGAEILGYDDDEPAQAAIQVRTLLDEKWKDRLALLWDLELSKMNVEELALFAGRPHHACVMTDRSGH
jgi:hypothetical protein